MSARVTIPDWLRTSLMLVGGLVLALLLGTFLLAQLQPQLVNDLPIIKEYVIDLSTSQANSFNEITGFRPLLDAVLLVASYCLVCLMLWAQSKVRFWIKNRHNLQ